jgi:citronellol/citronellal dehydrogenase
VIATAALDLLGGEETAKHGRTPEIVADAAVAVLRRPARACTGRFLIDEDVLREEGVTDFGRYAVRPGEPLMRDLFLD